MTERATLFATLLSLPVYVNDRNSDAALAHTVTNIRAGLVQTLGRAKLAEFVPVNNVFDQHHSCTRAAAASRSNGLRIRIR